MAEGKMSRERSTLFEYSAFYRYYIPLPARALRPNRLLELSSTNSVGVDAGARCILQWNGFVSGGCTRSGIKLLVVDSNQGRLEKIRMNETIRDWQRELGVYSGDLSNTTLK